jgi:ABC-type branched-subunit amino acid transport system substrate-binding protein
MARSYSSVFKLILCALLAWSLPVAGQAPAAPNQPVKATPTAESIILRIGLLVTDRGPGADRAEEVRAGAMLAVETINRTGGVHGIALRLEVAESEGDARSTVRAFSQLADQPDLVAIITAGEDDGATVRNLGEYYKVLVLSNSMRTDLLPNSSYMLRVGRSAPAAQEQLVQFMSKRKISRVGVFSGQDEWVSSLLQRFARPEPVKPYRIIFNEPAQAFTVAVEPKIISILKEENVELAYLASSPSDVPAVVAQLARNKVETAVATLYGCPSDEQAIALPTYEGSVYSVDVDTGGQSSRRAVVAPGFKARFPKLDLSVDALIGYDAAMMVAEAYRAGFGTSDAVRDFIVKQKVYFGAAGRLEFVGGGDTKRPVLMNVVDRGVCRPLNLLN